MSFRLRRSKSLPREVKRAARDELERVIEMLVEPVQDSDESIHQLRVGMKRMRALLRLLRDVLGEETYRAEQQRCKALADDFAGFRDAAVASALLDELLSGLPDPDLRIRIRAGFRGSPQVAAAASPGLDEALQRLRLMRRAVREWPLDSLRRRQLKARLGRQYRRGLRLYGDVGEDTAMALMHEWRKEVKRLLYQLELIRPEAGRTKVERRLKKLGSVLGDLHDLDMLELQIESHPELFWLDDRLALRRRLRERRAALRERALRLGGGIFAGSPAVFAQGRVAKWKAGH
ncbi:CHAD domain-containing protein [Marinobacterium nitratireducens]|uniref:CHAD domain-containing protein n=1 Tax=Marinobacterium nitratireducens TaxID=518897 RepID=A0A918DYS7_9GAMM|nr:CHAD domain-containing protein [Marinobacterium nitratireducens]GGO88687.1 CHAD domain-containing protein [Marinobacterium nitratireducens]